MVPSGGAPINAQTDSLPDALREKVRKELEEWDAEGGSWQRRRNARAALMGCRVGSVLEAWNEFFGR